MKQFLITIFFSFILAQIVFSQDSPLIKKNGIYYGLNIGNWFPANKNNVLGNSSLFGFTLDYKSKKNSYAVSFDLIGMGYSKVKGPFKIKFGDSLIPITDYSGALLTFDYCNEFYSSNRFAFEAMCGLGYSNISFNNSDLQLDVQMSSLVLTPGFSIRYRSGKAFYLQFKTQFCFANFKLIDNMSSDFFKGNYLISKVIMGGFIN